MILSLQAASLLAGAITIYSCFFGVKILRGWDLTSGSSAQLALERKTYLVSTLLAYLFAFELLSVFLFAHTADGLCHLFVGAMCAAGTLNVNGYGYPALLLKLVTFSLAGGWLLINHLDQKGRDYPLIRMKYRLLLALAPLLLTQLWLQWSYFLALEPDVITSCCGSLFGEKTPGADSLLSVPGPEVMRVAFFATEACVIALAVRFLVRGCRGYGFALASAVGLVVGVVSVISFISLYVYQLPGHTCPFCLLKPEYGRVGYPLYGLIFTGGLAGAGTGAVLPHTAVASLQDPAPVLLRRLALVAIGCHALLSLWVAWLIVSSDMRLLL